MTRQEAERLVGRFARAMTFTLYEDDAAPACKACHGNGKLPVYSAGEEMVADFETCRWCGGTGTEAGRAGGNHV